MNIFSNDKFSKEDIRASLLDLRNNDDVLIIRNGRSWLGPSEWKSFLLNDCGLLLDRRQYNLAEKIELSDWWEISYQPDKATSYAHSNTRQPFHTDNAWFSDPADLNFFIMEKQAISGGGQLIYKLTRLMEDLSKEEPGLFNELCTTKVIIKKGDEEYFNETTIIRNDEDPKIFWNYYRTDKNEKKINDLCEAFFRYLEKKESTSSIETVKSATGDCFAFNDTKILHGRKSFEAHNPFDRILLQSMWHFPVKKSFV